MRKRNVILGISLAVVSLLAVVSCDNNVQNTTASSHETVDFTNYQVTKEEFIESNETWKNDNFKMTTKNYHNSISDDKLYSTETLSKAGNWASFDSDVSGVIANYYCYYDTNKATVYYSDSNTIHSSVSNSNSVANMFSEISDYYDQLYDNLVFNEENKAYIGNNISFQSSLEYAIKFNFKVKFENKKMIYLEMGIVNTVANISSTYYSVATLEYGTATVAIPQSILDYHNQNYNK